MASWRLSPKPGELRLSKNLSMTTHQLTFHSGGAGFSDTAGRPWQTVHKTLADSMKERLEPYRRAGSLDVQPQEMRGTYDECRFLAKIIKRAAVDDDPHRSTGQVTFDLKNLGLTFIPGDRLAVMPLNSWSDVEVSRFNRTLSLIQLFDRK